MRLVVDHLIIGYGCPPMHPFNAVLNGRVVLLNAATVSCI
jgi:hypothetical protein